MTYSSANRAVNINYEINEKKSRFDQIWPGMSFGASTPKYLVLFYGVSSGANGANLGSDERDLVTLVYLVLNTEENKVSGMETYGLITL